jgi:hypothetical protein
MSAGLQGLLQATDRNGAITGRLDVVRWPITVGRALTADLVLDDSHVAAEHLRIDRTADGGVSVQVLDTVNGVALDAAHHGSGVQFIWPPGQFLVLGRLKLGLRLAGAPVTAEEPLPHIPWLNVAWTVIALLGVLAVAAGKAWLTMTEPSQLARQLPGILAVTVMAMMVWAGLWAMGTKLFTGRVLFWRHVRIACASSLAVEAGVALAGVLAFMFSLESLARFEVQLQLLGAAAAVYFHLMVIAPHRRRAMAALVTSVALFGIVLILGTTWLQNKRLSNHLYLSTLYPPSWRMATAVPVRQFLDETGALRQRLDQRLKDSDSDDGPDDGPDAE